ncbi:hypothetical protein [Vibrio sp. 1180_3]|uniref:hypothetical protein n=1 Tax=Vibrio sp. 1180_3 TaxID=2528832 RepID=UPI00240743C3|nr:hypothetical protein [Vibrio sp. 1180_3]MDF9399061.1 hypothetical protein [Vibrio sp. 1180_3]
MKELTKQHKIWPNKVSKFNVQNALLAATMGCAVHVDIPEADRITGFNVSKSDGYALLVHFVSLALGVNRLPFCKDRIEAEYLSDGKIRNLKLILKTLNEHELQSIINDVRLMYKHTQTQLLSMNIKSVRLRRNISIKERSDNNNSNYAHSLFRYLQAKKFLGHKTVEFEMDVLNSFTESTGEYSHLGDIIVDLDIDAVDVLFSSNLITSPHHNQLIESNEWVILNRSPNGLVTIPADDITIKESRFYNQYELTLEEAESIVSHFEPIHLRYKHDSAKNYGCRGVRMTWKTRLAYWLLK